MECNLYSRYAQGKNSLEELIVMKLIFYRAKFGNIVDKLTSMWTSGPYSHCELYFEDIDDCYSASPRENMCRFKKININDGHWEIVDLDDSKYDQKQIIRLAEDQLGKPYDWIGIIFSQIFPINKQDPNKWFCSEICAYLLGFDNPHKIDPNKLFKKIKGL